MTDEQKADRYAMSAEWNEANRDKCRKAAREWYARNRKRANNASWRYDQEHYQMRLAYWRERSRRINDAKRKKPYKARMSVRVPEWADNAAHARSASVGFMPMSIRMACANGLM